MVVEKSHMGRIYLAPNSGEKDVMIYANFGWNSTGNQMFPKYDPVIMGKFYLIDFSVSLYWLRFVRYSINRPYTISNVNSFSYSADFLSVGEAIEESEYKQMINELYTYLVGNGINEGTAQCAVVSCLVPPVALIPCIYLSYTSYSITKKLQNIVASKNWKVPAELELCVSEPFIGM